MEDHAIMIVHGMDTVISVIISQVIYLADIFLICMRYLFLGLVLLSVSCSSYEQQNGNNKSYNVHNIEDSAGRRKDVVFSVMLPPHRTVTLNYTGVFYKEADINFQNRSDSLITLYNNIPVRKFSLANFLSIYAGNPSHLVTFKHSFFCDDVDTIYLKCTDSSDIQFTRANKKSVRFIEDGWKVYNDKLITLNTYDEKSLKNYHASIDAIYESKNNQIKQWEANPESVEKLKIINEVSYFEYQFAVLSKNPKANYSKEQFDMFIDNFKKWLLQHRDYPNSLTGLFDKMYVVQSKNKNNCDLINFLQANEDLFGVGVFQGYVLYRLINYDNKKSECWKAALARYKKMDLYLSNRLEMDAIFQKFDPGNVERLLKAFVLKDETGKEKTLSHILTERKTQYYLLDFWATWCGPCKNQDKFLAQKRSQINPNIEIIKISLDQIEDSTKWKNMVASEKNQQILSFLSKEGFNSKLCESFMLNSIPRYILIDKNGEVVSENFNRPQDPLFITRLNAYK